MISNEFRFIFFHAPKAAGSSILGALKEGLDPCAYRLNTENEALLKYLSENWGGSFPNHAPARFLLGHLLPVQGIVSASSPIHCLLDVAGYPLNGCAPFG